MSKKDKTVGYDTMLSKINKHFEMMDQWGEEIFRDWGRVAQYMIMAETLIELLEIETCGSVGGFGRGQENFEARPNPFNCVDREMWSRFAFLDVKFNGGKHSIR